MVGSEDAFSLIEEMHFVDMRCISPTPCQKAPECSLFAYKEVMLFPSKNGEEFEKFMKLC